MKIPFRIFPIFLILLGLSACANFIDIGIEHPASSTATATSLPATQAPVSPAPPTEPPTLPPATQTPVPPAPTATNQPVPTTNPAPAGYLDDRSTPSQVIVSLYNAINRREYARAYGYWNNPSVPFSAYASGYQDTASVELVFGQITGDPGMSQVFFTVPVMLKTTARNGSQANFAACYIVHEVSQDVLSSPPAMPMGIERGQARPADANVSDAANLATACTGYPVGPNPVSAGPNSLDIGRNNFVDNRSGPLETVSSFLNALNQHQYVRAYSYYDAPSAYPGAFGPYTAGYANTDTITVTFGSVRTEGTAGSTYFKLALAEKVLNTDSTTQTFVGCYTLRLGQPANQTTPPFHPLGITAGVFKLVDNSTNVNALLPTACN